MRSITLVASLTVGLTLGSLAHAQDGKDTMKTRDDASIHALLGKHFTALNELDPEKRKALIAEAYDPHIVLIDPHVTVHGHAELDKLYQGIHQLFPGFVFRVVDDIDVHHERARVHWELAKPGTSERQTGDDIVTLNEGRIVEIIVFFNGQAKHQ